MILDRKEFLRVATAFGGSILANTAIPNIWGKIPDETLSQDQFFGSRPSDELVRAASDSLTEQLRNPVVLNFDSHLVTENTLRNVEALLANGVPVIASVEFELGEVQGNILPNEVPGNSDVTSGYTVEDIENLRTLISMPGVVSISTDGPFSELGQEYVDIDGKIIDNLLWVYNNLRVWNEKTLKSIAAAGRVNLTTTALGATISAGIALNNNSRAMSRRTFFKAGAVMGTTIASSVLGDYLNKVFSAIPFSMEEFKSMLLEGETEEARIKFIEAYVNVSPTLITDLRDLSMLLSICSTPLKGQYYQQFGGGHGGMAELALNIPEVNAELFKTLVDKSLDSFIVLFKTIDPQFKDTISDYLNLCACLFVRPSSPQVVRINDDMKNRVEYQHPVLSETPAYLVLNSIDERIRQILFKNGGNNLLALYNDEQTDIAYLQQVIEAGLPEDVVQEFHFLDNLLYIMSQIHLQTTQTQSYYNTILTGSLFEDGSDTKIISSIGGKFRFVFNRGHITTILRR